MKIISYLFANVSRIHWLNEKIEVLYDLWSSGYRKILPLLPAATAAVQEPAELEPDTVPEPAA